MLGVCVAPYTPGTQPVTKTIFIWPTGLIINVLRQNFSRFTINIYNTLTIFAFFTM